MRHQGKENTTRDWVVFSREFRQRRIFARLTLTSELDALCAANANPYSNALRLSVFDERMRHQRKEKHHPRLGGVFFGEEYWHMDEPISREKADLLCRSISLAFSGVKLIVSIASEKLYVIISLSG